MNFEAMDQMAAQIRNGNIETKLPGIGGEMMRARISAVI